MRERRTFVVLGLALLHLALAATVTLEPGDVAWAPSYFDGGDDAPLLLSERLPALVGAPGVVIPLQAAPAMVAARPPAPRRARARPLHRSPSLPLHARFPGGLPPASRSKFPRRGGCACSVWVLRS